MLFPESPSVSFEAPSSSAGCFGAYAYGSKPRTGGLLPLEPAAVTAAPDALLAAARSPPDDGVLGALAGRPRGPALAVLTRGEAFHPGRRRAVF